MIIGCAKPNNIRDLRSDEFTMGSSDYKRLAYQRSSAVKHC